MVESVIQIKNGIMINVDVSVKNIICEKDNVWNPENGKYLISIINDSVVTCDEIIDPETKAIPTNFNKKKYKL